MCSSVYHTLATIDKARVQGSKPHRPVRIPTKIRLDWNHVDSGAGSELSAREGCGVCRKKSGLVHWLS